MVFGDKEIFAIEAYLMQFEACVFIEYCFWVKGHMIGSLEDATLLPPVVHILESILKSKGQREMSNSSIYKDSELLDYFITSLWTAEKYKGPLDMRYHNSELKKFDICSHEGETFSGYYVFLLEQEGFDWLLCKDASSQIITSVKIPKDKFYKTLKETLDWTRRSTMLVLRPDYINK